jgi:hypothetical protein
VSGQPQLTSIIQFNSCIDVAFSFFNMNIQKPETNFEDSATKHILDKFLEKMSTVSVSDDIIFVDFCHVLHSEVKLASELLICLRFMQSESDVKRKSLELIRDLLLHKFAMRHYAINPGLATWFLHAIALLKKYFDVSHANEIAQSVVEFFGISDEDAPLHRNEECHFLQAMLRGEKYVATDSGFAKKFYSFNHDHIYALTHLLFYKNSYGSESFVADETTLVALEYLMFHAYKKRDIDMFLELLINYQAAENVNPLRCSTFNCMLKKLISKSGDFNSILAEGKCKDFNEVYHKSVLYLLLVNSKFYINSIGSYSIAIFEEFIRQHRFFSALHSSNFVRAAENYVRVKESIEASNTTRLSGELCSLHFSSYVAIQKSLLHYS